MAEPLNILVIEDKHADFIMVERHLKQKGLSARCSRVDSIEELKAAIDRENWDLALADYNVPQLDFLEGLNLMLTALPDLPVIVVTGTVGEEKAVDILRLGVRDFVLKKNLSRLVPAVQRAMKENVEIQECRRANKRLRESEAMYRSLFENMLNGFAYCRMIFDGEIPQDFIYLSVNQAFENQTGLRDVVGRRVTEVIPNIRQSDPGLFELYGRVALSGNPEQVEIFIEALDQWYWVSVYSPAREHFIAVFDVFTERKHAEKALSESRERLELALRGANDGLWDRDLKNNTIYYSPRWKSMLGYADHELENHCETWERLLHPEDKQLSLTRLNDFRGGRTSRYEVEFRLRHKEGHYVDILSRAFLVYDEQGEVMRLVGTHVDITERKKLEAQYRHAQKMEAVGLLAGGVAHDFNNILTAISGYSYLIINHEKGNDTVQNYAEEIIEASNRAATLNQGLLAFSRKQEVTLALIDLGDTLKRFEGFLRRLIREDIELEINCTEAPLTVMADRGQIEQVVMNLVANARDAMPGGGKLCIETGLVTLDREFVNLHGYGNAGAYALISVSDSGVGMDKETQSRVFEPFFTTKEQGKGTGLGLSMAYGIVKKHEGIINVYSEPGNGTIFKIYLPHVQATTHSGNADLQEAAVLQGGTETILVGEDDASLRRFATRVLSHYGYRVIEAQDGQDAVNKFIEHGNDIHLVILDAIMPKKNGSVAYQEMKRVRPELKTIFVSGYTRDIFEGISMNGENTLFINKPFSPNEFAAKVRDMLDR